MKPMRKLSLVSVLTLLPALGWPHSQAVKAEDAPKQQAAEAVVEKVQKHIKRSEKAEGKQDQVKDQVQLKTDPTTGKPIVEETGEASYYGKGFQGKKTAHGEKFKQQGLTAAHPTLPLGTKAKVTNLETGKSVEVRVNDRGPKVKGRDLDLSKAAAQKVGIKKKGVAPVKIEAEVAPTEKRAGADTKNDAPAGLQKE